MEPVSKKKHHRRLRRPVLLLILAAVLALAVGGTLLMRREQPEEIISTASHGELMDKTSEEVASLTVTQRDGESYTLLQRTAGVLTLADDEAFVVSDRHASSMLSACATIAYEDILTEDKDAYAQYFTEFGLDEPLTVEITYTDGSAICLRIGSKGPLEEDTWYYMTVEGDTRLFALSRGIEEELDVSRAQLYPVTQPTIHQARLDAITFTGEDEEILAQWLLEGEITDSDAAASWRMTVPWSYPADEEAMTNLRKNLANLRLGAYVEEATAGNLATYGLDSPRFTLTLHMAAGSTGSVDEEGVYSTTDWPESTFIMQIGDAKSDAVDYVLVDGGIYLCSHYSLAIFTDMDVKNTISRYPLMVELDDLATMAVEDASGTVVYTLRRQERVAANNELVTDENGEVVWDVFCDKDGAEVSYSAFSAAWEQLRAVRVTGWLPDGFTATEPVHTTLTFTTVTGKTHTLALAPYDALHDAVIVDGTALFYLISGGLMLQFP